MLQEQTQESALIDAFIEAEEGLVSYRKILLKTGQDEVEPAPFHSTWSDSLLHGTMHEAIMGFRESAKGQYVLRAYPLYALTYPHESRDYIVIIKQNARLAEAKLKEIGDEYLTNPAINSNAVQVRSRSAQVLSIDVRDPHDPDKIVNVRIEAYGKGASIRGLDNQSRRPRIVIIDDPQDLEDSRSDTVLNADWKWFLDDVKFLGKKSRIFIIGNNLGEKCLIQRIIDNAKDLGFKTSVVGVELPPDETLPARSSWPAMFPLDFIRQEKEEFRRMGELDVWMRERMCLATSEETRIIPKSALGMRYGHPYMDSFIRQCNIFATLDPASSEDKAACLRAIVVNAVRRSESGQILWFILDVRHGKWDSAQTLEEMFSVVTTWHPMHFGIEKGMYEQVIRPFLHQEMLRRNIMFHVKQLEHARMGTKLERCKMLGPRFKAGGIWLPESASWLAEFESECLGLTNDGFKSLYTDVIDALAMQEQLAVPPMDSSEEHRRHASRAAVEKRDDYNPITGRRTGDAIPHRSPLAMRYK